MPENMSNKTKRKITVEPTLNKNKDSQRRPSVFERLGTKATSSSGTNPTSNDNFCRHWAQSGNCPFGKTCKYANTHTLISPSKQRAAKKEGDVKQKQGHSSSSKLVTKDDLNKRLHSTVVVKKTHSPDLNWENWDQTDLEYEDEKVLEKRRQLLQRELDLQMKREKEEQQRQKKERKNKKVLVESAAPHLLQPHQVVRLNPVLAAMTQVPLRVRHLQILGGGKRTRS
ncbi:hypothetical protein C0J52_09246 [Blattella germanica]|nr:hypothetical protein C0J52_09246 [Blattella germanica]